MAVRQLVTGWLAHGVTSDLVLERAECAALELRAHGASPTAALLLERVVAARGTDGAARSGEEPCLWKLFSAHYYTGRLAEAAAAYAVAAASDTTNVKPHAALAAIAARRGDTLELARQRAWLASHPSPVSDYSLARVAVLLRRREEAMALLRKAMEGDLERHFLHLDPDFESLRDYQPYRELLRPKG
jgi:tetratricopeptide (TPR) repeat protein